ncbi:MAG: hypothetical protein ACOYL6_06240 [Bacteriovoracaceae bacterium]
MFIISLLVALLSLSAFAEELSIGISYPVGQGSELSSVRMAFDVPQKCASHILEVSSKTNKWLDKVRYGQPVDDEKEGPSSYISKKVPISCQDYALELVATESAAYVYGSGHTSVQMELFVKFLSKIQSQHIIRVLNPETRNKYPELRKPEVLGAYSCPLNRIWLDLGLTPLNMGSIYIHELEHWARERYMSTSGLKVGNNSITSLNRKQYRIADEALSSLHSAFRQIKLKHDPNRSSDDRVRDFPIRFQIVDGLPDFSPRPYNFFSSKGDLNLYNPNGSLVGIWKQGIRDHGISKKATFLEFLRDTLFSDKMRIMRQASKIFRLVEEIYFLKESPDAAVALNTLRSNSKSINAFLSPLEWAVRQDFSIFEDATKLCSDTEGPFPGGEGAGFYDNELKLSNGGIKACLKPLKKL